MMYVLIIMKEVCSDSWKEDTGDKGTFLLGLGACKLLWE